MTESSKTSIDSIDLIVETKLQFEAVHQRLPTYLMSCGVKFAKKCVMTYVMTYAMTYVQLAS